MNRPYIICHMMSSIDGRIDCAMTEQLSGTEDYYKILASLDVPTRVSGRVTAELEMALPGKFTSETKTPLKKKAFYKAVSADGYEVVVDTNGTLLWNDQRNVKRPLLILTSERVCQEYLEYLEEKQISWIACGKQRVDLNYACHILAREFGVERMAIVGGGHINAGFLAANLLDEISLLIGPGIDGRKGMGAVFDGFSMSQSVTALKLEFVQAFESGAVWLRYKTIE